jgi:hypothetical protein
MTFLSASAEGGKYFSVNGVDTKSIWACNIFGFISFMLIIVSTPVVDDPEEIIIPGDPEEN